MAAKVTPIGAFGKMHTSGIFANMAVDGPNIGTLVVIMDRAKNLPNRRTMGKQDPYCAARLGKEAKKTNTDKRGGQTPRWDQELRFQVHDSPDYHQLKVSVFNDDKKTELIGETWIGLENVLLPGGGQSDGWHGLNCKGKYAGEIRIELTYYDTRPKEKAPAERKKESARADMGSPAVGGARAMRESAPVKRRPLPTDPTGASPSPAATPERRGLPAQAGPRAYQTPPQQRSQPPEVQPSRRPAPEASPLSGTPASAHHTPQPQQRTPQQPQSQPPQPPPIPELDAYSTSPNPSMPSAHTPQYNGNSYDLSYAGPKPYEVQPLDPTRQQVREHSHRAASQDNFRSSNDNLAQRIDPPHSYSAPVVPTQHTSGYPPADRYQPQDPYPPQDRFIQQEPQPAALSQPHDRYQDPQFQIEPLRPSRSNTGLNQVSYHDPYQAAQPPQAAIGYHETPDPYASHVTPNRSYTDLQPTVEDEDEAPPPPPVHRSNAATISQHHQQRPPSYHSDAPAPLNITRFREESPSTGYGSPPQPYGMDEYAAPAHTERRYTHPQPSSRPVSRDTMAPSPLRTEASMLPASLVAGIDTSRPEHRMSMTVRAEKQEPVPYQPEPAYETPSRLRQLSEPNYGTPPQYETPPSVQQLTHHSMPMDDAPAYYSHAIPEEPRHVSPVHDPLPLVKPRAMSPVRNQVPYPTHNHVEPRTSRTNMRSMPTRKSVSPRPPPSANDSGERRLSGVAFSPDDFDVYNPAVAKKTQSSSKEKSSTGSGVEVDEKGQVVTFSGRVIDASDHLPLDSWAPEPEPKGTKKGRPQRERAVPNGSRDLEGALQREREYRRERMEKEKIRAAAANILGADSGSPSNALVPRGHHYSSSSGSPMNSSAMVLHGSSESPSGGRNRLQKQRPTSSFIPPASSSPSGREVLRERENLRGYGGSPGYGNVRHSVAAPPIPAKVPLEGAPHHEDMTALSLELQSIDIGPPSGGRQRGTVRQRYAGY